MHIQVCGNVASMISFKMVEYFLNTLFMSKYSSIEMYKLLFSFL